MSSRKRAFLSQEHGYSLRQLKHVYSLGHMVIPQSNLIFFSLGQLMPLAPQRTWFVGRMIYFIKVVFGQLTFKIA
jgi:hypothetical protein